VQDVRVDGPGFWSPDPDRVLVQREDDLVACPEFRRLPTAFEQPGDEPAEPWGSQVACVAVAQHGNTGPAQRVHVGPEILGARGEQVHNQIAVAWIRGAVPAAGPVVHRAVVKKHSPLLVGDRGGIGIHVGDKLAHCPARLARFLLSRTGQR
jgi:hypothetical protein